MKWICVSGVPRPLDWNATRPRRIKASFSMSSAPASMDISVRVAWSGNMDRLNGSGRFRDRFIAALDAKAYMGPSLSGGRSGMV